MLGGVGVRVKAGGVCACARIGGVGVLRSGGVRLFSSIDPVDLSDDVGEGTLICLKIYRSC